MTHPKKLEQSAEMIRLVDRQSGVSRKAKLEARRERQRTRTAGFTPVRNKRVSDAVTSAMAAALALNAKSIAEATAAGKTPPPELTPERANALAWNQVRGTLPSIPIGRKGITFRPHVS